MEVTYEVTIYYDDDYEGPIPNEDELVSTVMDIAWMPVEAKHVQVVVKRL